MHQFSKEASHIVKIHCDYLDARIFQDTKFMLSNSAIQIGKSLKSNEIAY